MQLLKNKVSKSTIKFVAKEEKDVTTEENSYVDVEKENEDEKINKNEENNDIKENEITEKRDDKVSDENTSLMVLGEIMMGGVL